MRTYSREYVVDDGGMVRRVDYDRRLRGSSQTRSGAARIDALRLGYLVAYEFGITP
jgi:hypothetical protein